MTKEEFIDKWEYLIPEFYHVELAEDLDSVIQQAIAEHQAGKTVIKAKALRKKGTDKWYVAYESGKIPNQETLYFNETRSINGAAHNYDFWYKSQNFYPPADAELIDIEIIVKAGGEK